MVCAGGGIVFSGAVAPTSKKEGMNNKTRSRMVLVTITLIFFGSFGLAGLLRFSGWQPSGRTNSGQLLPTPIDATQAIPVRADGAPYAWRAQPHTWRIVVFAPAA